MLYENRSPLGNLPAKVAIHDSQGQVDAAGLSSGTYVQVTNATVTNTLAGGMINTNIIFVTVSGNGLAVGNPVLWWSVAAALLAMVWLLVSRRDWRAGAVLAAVAAGWLPWFWYADHDNRTMFSFYAVSFLPFLVMAVTICLGLILGPKDASPTRRTVGATAVGCYLLLAALAAVALTPLWLAEVIPYQEWLDRLLGIKSWI